MRLPVLPMIGSAYYSDPPRRRGLMHLLPTLLMGTADRRSCLLHRRRSGAG
jgi:hypothetical protein